MYEDRTQDTIMQEMMSQFGADVRTDEGSLAYNACARIASELEDVYADMDELNDNMLPDTQDLAHLIRFGEMVGVAYKYATFPIVKGVFSQEIEIGERFNCNDYSYAVKERIDGYTYKLECENEGTEANANVGALEPIDYVDDYLGGNITEVLTLGTDDEDEAVYRKRITSSFATNAFGGNKQYYISQIDAIQGVGGCKPKRRSAIDNTINIWIVNSLYAPASTELVAAVQNAIDPSMDGEGNGLAPINHVVNILSAEGVEISVSTSITWEDGYSGDTTMLKVQDAVAEYIGSLAQSWETNGDAQTIVRVAQIEARILSVEGVADVTGTSINNSSDNFVLLMHQVPVYGGVTNV